MREIKFRGYSKECQRWVYGYYYGGLRWADFIIEDAGFENRVQVDPSTVGQFTGLLDKNGEEIYEGDIVNAIAEIDFKPQTCISDVICSIEECYQFCIRSTINGAGNRNIDHGLQINWGGWESLEIIDNIHDNPKLLK
ncbi:MAG: YopX family protein [Alistipes sp.]